MKYRLPGLFLILLLTVAALVGCGGGGGESAPPVDTELFTPNYISSLDLLLHWNHLPMRASFEVPANSQQEYGWDAGDLTQTTNQWNQPGKQALVTVVPHGTSSDVVVRFVSRDELGGSVNSTGITTITYNPSSRAIATAEIKVSPESPFGGNLSPTDIRVTVAHEIGHAIGIHGHSPTPGDLMHATSQLGRQYPPTVRDFNTAMSAYPAYFTPGYLGTEGYRAPQAVEGPFVTVRIE